MLSLIVAVDMKNGIGKDNKLPWHLPADLSYFKEKTMGKTIVMGRKTFTSLPGGPLKGRTHIVLTRDESFAADHPDVTIEHDLGKILSKAQETDEEILVIGGAEIYRHFYPHVDRLYLTRIMGEFDVDTWIPFYKGYWKEVSAVKREKDEKNPYDMIFYTYDRGNQDV